MLCFSVNRIKCSDDCILHVHVIIIFILVRLYSNISGCLPAVSSKNGREQHTVLTHLMM